MAGVTMKSVIRALAVLEAVAEMQPIGVGALSTSLGQPKSSVQRALETLAVAGWISRTADEPIRWELTFRAARLARQTKSHFGLREAALPMMEELRTKTKESIHLAAVDGANVVLIERLVSPLAVRHVEPLGGRASIIATATGKAVLASLPLEAVGEIHANALAAPTDPAHGPYPTLGDLKVELRDIRARGFATTSSWRDGVFATGVAIARAGEAAIGALSISAPSSRVPVEVQEWHAKLLIEAGRRIVERLG